MVKDTSGSQRSGNACRKAKLKLPLKSIVVEYKMWLSGSVLGLTTHTQCGCVFESNTVRRKNNRETPGSHDLDLARLP